MDTTPQLARLDALARALAADEGVLALLALGSLGRERERADRFSDLDFFVLVKDGEKARFVGDLGWLRAVGSIAFSFANTPDGHKVLFDDGMFAELAVFTLDELAHIPFAPGRVVWARDGVDPARLLPRVPLPPPSAHGEAWLVGEILTNVLVGLQRDARGERLAGMRMIQVHAVDLWLALEDQRARAADPARAADGRDPFNATRRLERRAPQQAALLARVCPGYGRNRDAARALLECVVALGVAPAPLVDAIERLLAAVDAP